MMEEITVIEGRAVNYKRSSQITTTSTISPTGTQEMLTQFHALNLNNSVLQPEGVNHERDSDACGAINYSCSCGNVGDCSNTRISSSEESRSSDSGSDDDDDFVAIQKILTLLIAAEVRGHCDPRRHTMLLKLASGCTPNEAVSDVCLKQFLKLMSSHLDAVIEVSLAVLCGLSTDGITCGTLLQMNVFHQTLLLIQSGQSERVIRGAVQLLSELMKHQQFKDVWLESMILQGLPLLMEYVTMKTLQLVHSEETNPLLISVCWLLSEGALHYELAVLMLDQYVPRLVGLASLATTAQIEDPLVSLLCNLSSHNDYTASSLLGREKLLQRVNRILLQASCLIQKKVIIIYHHLLSTGRGLEVFIGEEIQLSGALAVIQVTHCRNVRRSGFDFLHDVLTRVDQDQWERLLSIVSQASSKSTSRGRRVLQATTKGAAGKSGKKPQERGTSNDHSGLGALWGIMMQAVYTEGKFDVDDNSVRKINFRPGADDCGTLHVIVQCFLQILSHVSHITNPNSYRNTSSQTLTGRRILQLCKLNILHMVALLNVFSPASPCCKMDHHLIQRNVEILYLRASLKVWQHVNGKMSPLTLSKEEQGFIKCLLELFLELANLSCTVWSEDLISQLERETLPPESNTAYGDSCARVSHCGIFDGYDMESVNVGDRHCSRIEGNHTKLGRELAWGRKETDEKSKGKREVGWRTAHNQSGYNDPSSNGASRGLNALVLNGRTTMREGSGAVEQCYSRWALNSGKERPSSRTRTSKHASVSRSRNDKRVPEVIFDGRGDEGDKKRRIQKELRRKLLIGGMIEAACSWVGVQDEGIQHTAISILHCLIQPFHRDEIKEHFLQQECDQGVLGTQKIRVQQMTESLAERDRLLTDILEQVSAQTAGAMTDALRGQRSNGNDKKHPERRKLPSKKNPVSGQPLVASLSLKRDEPISFQVILWCLGLLGPRLITLLQQASDPALMIKCLHLIRDIAKYGEIIIHLTLASHGVLATLIGITTRTDLPPLVSLLTIQTLQLLVGDLRMKQLFLGECSYILLEQARVGSENEQVRDALDTLLTSVSQDLGHVLP